MPKKCFGWMKKLRCIFSNCHRHNMMPPPPPKKEHHNSQHSKPHKYR